MSLLPHLGLALALFGSVSGAAPHSARSAARSPTGTAAESCGPSFAEIYDFQVGDIFQDTWSPPASIGGNGEIVRSLDRKYRIVSRERLPDRSTATA